MVRLRFTFDVEFDSRETAMAYGVALGFALQDAQRRAIELSESAAAAVRRCNLEVTPAETVGGNG